MKKYSEMPPLRASLQKWSDGQRIHGTEFQGDALAHLYEEQLDSFNYIAELENQGRLDPELLVRWRMAVELMQAEIWSELQERANRPSVAEMLGEQSNIQVMSDGTELHQAGMPTAKGNTEGEEWVIADVAKREDYICPMPRCSLHYPKATKVENCKVENNAGFVVSGQPAQLKEYKPLADKLKEEKKPVRYYTISTETPMECCSPLHTEDGRDSLIEGRHKDYGAGDRFHYGCYPGPDANWVDGGLSLSPEGNGDLS